MRINAPLRRSREGRRRERGAVLVEMTMVVPILVILVIGMLEIGLAWSTSTEVTAGTRQGARVGSHLATEPDSDREALRAFIAAMGDKSGDIERVVIYMPDNSGVVPSNCLTSSQTNRCNSYSAFQLTQLDDDSRWGCGSGRYDNAWCPTNRDNATIQRVGLGFHAVVNHEYVTGFFGVSDRDISARTVMRLEPDVR